MGICCNYFSKGLSKKYIKDFSWCGEEMSEYSLEKAMEHIANWKKMKHENLSPQQANVLKHIFEKKHMQ